MPEVSDPVVLRPPVEVVRPKSVPVIPAEDGLPGGSLYQLKVDGFRALAFVLPGRVMIQSRSGRDLAGEFPQVTAALGSLPVGTVLDGELCAYRDGRLAFNELLRTQDARDRAGVLVAYVAFDVLAVPGRDVRGLPLRERWALLGEVLEGAGPLVQRVLATTDRATAVRWYEAGHEAASVEGVVAKALDSAYRPGTTGAWLKIRHAETEEAALVAVAGPLRRPRALVVELPGGRRVATSPRLDSVQSRQVGEIVSGLVAEAQTDGEEGMLWPVTEPMRVEVLVGTGRHGTVRFVRLRPPE